MYTFIHNNNLKYIYKDQDEIFGNMNPIVYGNDGIFYDNFALYSLNSSSSLETISITLSTDDVIVIFQNSTPYSLQATSSFVITPASVPTYSSCVSIANFYTPLIEGSKTQNYTHYLKSSDAIFLQRYNYNDNVNIQGEIIINAYTPAI